MVKLKNISGSNETKDFLQSEKEKKILADFQSKCKLGKADIDQTEP
jgi:hypothetical protein